MVNVNDSIRELFAKLQGSSGLTKKSKEFQNIVLAFQRKVAHLCCRGSLLNKSGGKVCRGVQLNTVYPPFITEVSCTNNVFAVHPESLQHKCVMVISKDKMHIIPLPNNVERDKILNLGGLLLAFQMVMPNKLPCLSLQCCQPHLVL